jgi:hypothetical protein
MIARSVVLGQALVEPERNAADVVVDEQVHVLVIDDSEIVEPPFERQGDVVHGLARQEKSSRVGADFPQVQGFQRLVAFVRLEDDDGRRRHR